MTFNQRFIAGRMRHRLLRPPIVEGWLCDEQNLAAPTRIELAFRKLSGGALGLTVPHATDMAKLGREAATAASEPGTELLIGWPESMIVVRRASAVRYAEGDMVHFGRLHLDANHTIERTGYQYLSDDAIEVSVQLTVTAPGGARDELLAPGAQLKVGPYTIENVHSFDPTDRPGSVQHHGYNFRVRRAQDSKPPPDPPPGLPHPLDVESAAALIALARTGELLQPDEAVWGEPHIVSGLLDRYEGPRASLEQTLRETGPAPAQLSRRGETLVVEAPRVARGSHGEAEYGRARIALDPAFGLTVERTVLGQMPGRLRRQPTVS